MIKIGGNIVVGDVDGNSVTINGMTVTSRNGVTVISGAGDMPEVHEKFDGINSVQVESQGTVYVKTGDGFSADGHSEVRKVGSEAVVSSFDGELTVPRLDNFSASINSGRVKGEIESTTLDVKVNSGNVTLNVRNKNHNPSISAKVNSGSVNITVL